MAPALTWRRIHRGDGFIPAHWIGSYLGVDCFSIWPGARWKGVRNYRVYLDRLPNGRCGAFDNVAAAKAQAENLIPYEQIAAKIGA